MFEKLLAVLPYNPSLVHQLAFYSKRMRQEQSVRRTGLVFIVLAFLIQFFAVVSPPQPTVAYSSNDMINGGFSSKSEAVSACTNNLKSYRAVLSNFGISCDDVAKATTTTISSTDHDKQLYSMGWLSYGQKNPDTGKPTGQVPLNLVGVPASDQPLYARYLWSFDTYSHSDYKALVVKNSAGKTFYILYSCGNLVAIGVPAPLQRCQYNQNLLATDSQCYKPCQYNKNIPASSTQCFPPCPIPGKENLPQSSPQCVNPCPYNKSLPANSPKCFPPCQYNKSIASTSPQCFPPCQYNATISSSSPDCKPCDKSVSSQDTLACLVVHKTAANLTQNLSDANNTTAQAGDKIDYTLYAQNNGKAAIQQFIFQENLSDVLDYATVLDLHGGSIDSNNVVTWPAVNIAPGATVTERISVQVKDPIPQTPTAPSDGGHFDLIMTNVYGNTININLPGSPAKTVQLAVAALPNTGPGSSLFMAAAIVIVGGYFYARSRLLATEAQLAIQDNVSGGL